MSNVTPLNVMRQLYSDPRSELQKKIDLAYEELCKRMINEPIISIGIAESQAEDLISQGMDWMEAVEQVYPLPDGAA